MSQLPSISHNGSAIAFLSYATDLTNNVISGYSNITYRNLQGTPTTTLMTPNAGGTDGGNAYSSNPVLSADGSTVAFISYATNFAGGTPTAWP